jgi:hypothetical protein
LYNVSVWIVGAVSQHSCVEYTLALFTLLKTPKSCYKQVFHQNLLRNYLGSIVKKTFAQYGNLMPEVQYVTDEVVIQYAENR